MSTKLKKPASGITALAIALCFGASPPPENPQPADPAFLAIAADLSLTPEALAACGMQSSASAVLNALHSATDSQQDIVSKKQALNSAAANATALSRQVMINSDDQSLQSQYQAALSLVQSLRQQIATAKQALLSQITQGVPPDQVQKLIIFLQSDGRRVPPEFRVKQETDEQWDAIGLALLAERRAQRMNQSLVQEQATLLSDIRADPDVVQASTNLQNSLAQIQGLFAQIAPPPPAPPSP